MFCNALTASPNAGLKRRKALKKKFDIVKHGAEGGF